MGHIAFQENRHHAMIAKAGVLTSANQFEDLFSEEAAKITPARLRQIADMAENVMKKVRAKIMGLFAEAAPWTDESKRQHLQAYDFEILLAYYFDDQPYITFLAF